MSSTRLLILGGGPAGTEAALSAAAQGARVTLVSASPPGGRAAHETLLPAKIWLAQTLHASPAAFDLPELRENIAAAACSWQNVLTDQLNAAGVRLVRGSAAFEDPHTLRITPCEDSAAHVPPADGLEQAASAPDETLRVRAERILIATGSLPYLPPALQTDGRVILSPHQIWRIERLPEHLLVIGGGGPAIEYVELFARLGVRVTWIVGPVRVLSAFPQEVGAFLTQRMARRGVTVIEDIAARSASVVDGQASVTLMNGMTLTADLALVAIGHRPDLQDLNLSAAGLKPSSRGSLRSNAYGQSEVAHIYVAGDAAAPLSVNAAQAQGRIAALHALGLAVEPFAPETLILGVYTHPQVAMVGRFGKPGEAFTTVRADANQAFAAHLAGEQAEGCFVELSIDGIGRIAGGLAIAPDAAQMLAPVALAIRLGARLADMASIFAALPAYAELPFLLARRARHVENVIEGDLDRL